VIIRPIANILMPRFCNYHSLFLFNDVFIDLLRETASKRAISLSVSSYNHRVSPCILYFCVVFKAFRNPISCSIPCAHALDVEAIFPNSKLASFLFESAREAITSPNSIALANQHHVEPLLTGTQSDRLIVQLDGFPIGINKTCVWGRCFRLPAAETAANM